MIRVADGGPTSAEPLPDGGRHQVEITTPTGHRYRSRAPAPTGHRADIYTSLETRLREILRAA